MNDINKEKKKWWQFRKSGPDDYGRIAILCLLVFGFKDVAGPINPFLEILLNILGIWGAFAAIMWLKKKIQVRKRKD